jgi:3-isopropylmalate/(R)-2-methylmalate dehydratase small subunit
MEKFLSISGYAASIPMSNVNTDMITPKNVMKSVTKKGLAWGLFQNFRFNPDGSKKQDFVLNKAPWNQAKIIVSMENWGCGSSREHAPWAMYDFGIRSVIAISFADIHYNNCFKNGILPVRLAHDQILQVQASAEAGEIITVNLETQQVKLLDGTCFQFEIDAAGRLALLAGYDEIDQTMLHAADIDAFEIRHKALVPWLFNRTSL